jgi:dynein heavy chain, axonemal
MYKRTIIDNTYKSTAINSIFSKMCLYLNRACRVLRQANGHLLLIGLDGTGKTTIVELASFISSCEVFRLNMKKGYAHVDFRDDLKSIYKLTGVQKKKIAFLVADKDIYDVRMFLDEDFLS